MAHARARLAALLAALPLRQGTGAAAGPAAAEAAHPLVPRHRGDPGPRRELLYPCPHSMLRVGPAVWYGGREVYSAAGPHTAGN